MGPPPETGPPLLLPPDSSVYATSSSRLSWLKTMIVLKRVSKVIQPYRVADPILWLLSKAHMVPVTRGH